MPVQLDTCGSAACPDATFQTLLLFGPAAILKAWAQPPCLSHPNAHVSTKATTLGHRQRAPLLPKGKERPETGP